MSRYPVRRAPDSQAAAGGVTAVDRALLVLTAFGESGAALTLSELSERVGLVPSTTSRLLASLMHFGFVQRRADARYVLGPASSRLHRAYVASFNLESLVLPALQQLATQTHESASFHIRQGEHRLVLYRVNSTRPLADHSHTGDLLPLSRGSGGHVLLAFHAEQGPLYDRIRRDGYMAAPVSDRAAELAGVSAAVFDAQQAIVGVVTLTMPAQRYQDAHIKAVCDTASLLTRQQGGKPVGSVPAGLDCTGQAGVSDKG